MRESLDQRGRDEQRNATQADSNRLSSSRTGHPALSTFAGQQQTRTSTRTTTFSPPRGAPNPALHASPSGSRDKGQQPAVSGQQPTPTSPPYPTSPPRPHARQPRAARGKPRAGRGPKRLASSPLPLVRSSAGGLPASTTRRDAGAPPGRACAHMSSSPRPTIRAENQVIFAHVRVHRRNSVCMYILRVFARPRVPYDVPCVRVCAVFFAV